MPRDCNIDLDLLFLHDFLSALLKELLRCIVDSAVIGPGLGHASISVVILYLLYNG